ncbi:SH3 domain-containing protein [Catalinimonas alkaloidigena]|uniref:SH3 domain-containing protein n=1 Tax=Catalinimonas alkaloidigena TaxID=1075417 RepID=A0A1G9MY40_9BACT|nr:C40 family peptidase [Catalinimonas alkaloidigena]SDL79034.1 SH3 domain-containing protein [Catalinimonas alkaloidigena]
MKITSAKGEAAVPPTFLGLPLVWICLVLSALSACQKPPAREQVEYQALVDSLQNVYAPDRRTARFDVELDSTSSPTFRLVGETDQPEAHQALQHLLKSQGFAGEVAVQLLPDTTLPTTRGLVRLSVANLRTDPRHSAELATQALLGTPVRVLKKEGGWYMVQTPDRYIAWVDAGGLTLPADSSYAAWEQSEKIIVLSRATYALEEPRAEAASVSDLVAGDLLQRLGEQAGYYEVGFPDGRTAWLAKEDARPWRDWATATQPTETNLVASARTLMGTPYLWGGTSTKGVDCSGFTKTVYLLNGWILPRDASQQVLVGQQIEPNEDFSNLRPGDLLFFGRPATDSTRERVVHVGMWIGDREFIHASGQVRISSVDPTAENYDAYERNRFLRAKRLLQSGDRLPNGLVPATQLYEWGRVNQ